jgi:hypothetical protein
VLVSVTFAPCVSVLTANVLAIERVATVALASSSTLRLVESRWKIAARSAAPGTPAPPAPLSVPLQLAALFHRAAAPPGGPT